MAILFFAMGAKPIPIFLGFDFLAVLQNKHNNNKQTQQHKQKQVSADEVRVVHEVGAQKRTVWRSPTAFTRVEVAAKGQPELRVTLALSRRRLVVAGQVSPQERVAFADALLAAIKSARAERHPT